MYSFKLLADLFSPGPNIGRSDNTSYKPSFLTDQELKHLVLEVRCRWWNSCIHLQQRGHIGHIGHNLSLSNDIIPVSSSARNLGFIFDSDMSFSDQIKSVSKSCHFHIRDIRRIRHLLPLSAATALANSLVSSKLDYCNSLYSGISQVNLNKLQRIQNSLACVITNTSKYQHITPILKKLHWLPIKQRIDYKLCLLTYKTLTNQQPTYLYNNLSFPSHSVSTRSSDSLVLSIPYVRSSLGKRAFSVIGPRLWNSLPPDTRNSSSLPIFRSRLKTHLFKIAFPP